MAELSDILEKFKTPILTNEIVQCGISVLNVVKKSIAFRIGYIGLPQTVDFFEKLLFFPEICRIKENPQAYIFWPFFITLVHVRLNMLFKEYDLREAI